MKCVNNDINDSLGTLEDKQEHLENQSRLNNVNIFSVPEDKDEKSWNDTETVVKTLIRNKLEIQDGIEIERAHRVGNKIKSRPQSGGHFESLKESLPAPHPIIAKIRFWKVKENILKTVRKNFVNDFSQRTLKKREEKILD